MSKTNNASYILRLALTLLTITAVMGALLAGVNLITKPMIEVQKAAKIQAAIEAVLPGGGEEIPFPDKTGTVSKVYASDTGYAVEVSPAGFKGAITMMVGVSREGKVLGIQIIEHGETAGLGSIAAESSAAGEAFRNQFVGTSGHVAVDKDGGEIDSLTGATVTSRAISNGVNAALACVAQLQEVAK